MKKRLFVLLTAICMLFSVVPAFAAEQRVFDNADLLDEYEEEDVQTWCEDMQNNFGIDLAFVTTNGLGNMTIEDFGADYFLSYDMGMGENDDGVIFVLDMDSREGKILTSGEAINIYTDFYVDEMWENMVDYLSDGEYYNAFYSLYYDMDYYAAEYEKYLADPDAYLSEYEKETTRDTILMFAVIGLVLGLIVAAIGVSSMKKKCKNVRPYTDGRDYLKENGLRFTTDRDTFANTRTTMAPIPKHDDNNGGFTGGSDWGGGSSTFTSGGHTFGGGGGKF